MHLRISCTATFELLHCKTLHYIHFNGEATTKG
jgi:hypothetical protein